MTAGRTVNAASREWGTPLKYVRAVKEFFGGAVDLDPCTNAFSLVGAEREYRLPENDGLIDSWNYPRIFVNPPYGTDREAGTSIKRWIGRCWGAHEAHGAEVLALVPVASNTSHWKEFVWGKASGIAFLYDTRLKFLVNGRDEGKGAPMACAMVYWGTQFERFFEVFSAYGAVLEVTSARTCRKVVKKEHSE